MICDRICAPRPPLDTDAACMHRDMFATRQTDPSTTRLRRQLQLIRRAPCSHTPCATSKRLCGRASSHTSSGTRFLAPTCTRPGCQMHSPVRTPSCTAAASRAPQALQSARRTARCLYATDKWPRQRTHPVGGRPCSQRDWMWARLTASGLRWNGPSARECDEHGTSNCTHTP